MIRNKKAFISFKKYFFISIIVIITWNKSINNMFSECKKSFSSILKEPNLKSMTIKYKNYDDKQLK